ncbi:MAG: rhomboid family intramembrane serine protease [Aggregatilineales bacterium]
MSLSESNSNSAPSGPPAANADIINAIKAANDASPRAVQLRLPTVRPIVTYGLLAAIVGIYVVMFVMDQTSDTNAVDPILAFGVLDPVRVLANGEWYRLLTAMFLHLSPAHIFFNAYALWRFGQTVEATFGHVRFTLIYFLGGLTGSLASLILGHDASAGASGAIFSIFAAEMVFVYVHRELLGARAGAALRELLILAAVNLGLGLITTINPSGEQIDNWAHIGGFVGGFALSWLIAPHFVIDRTPDNARVVDSTPFTGQWPFAVAGALLLLIIGLVARQTLHISS